MEPLLVELLETKQNCDKIPAFGCFLAAMLQTKTQISRKIIFGFLENFYKTVNENKINLDIQLEIEQKLIDGKLGQADALLRESLNKFEESVIICSICDCKVNCSDLKMLEKCDHLFHADCLEGYLHTKIHIKEFPISCPSKACPYEIQIIDMDLLDPAFKRNYEEYSTQKLLSSGIFGKFIPCPKCHELYAVSDRDVINCDRCKIEFCLNCDKSYEECRCFNKAPLFKPADSGKFCPFCSMLLPLPIQGKITECGFCSAHVCYECLHISDDCRCGYEIW